MVFNKNLDLEQFCKDKNVIAIKQVIKDHKFRETASVIKDFCLFMNKEPSELIKEQRLDRNSENPIGIMETNAFGYFDWLQGNTVDI